MVQYGRQTWKHKNTLSITRLKAVFLFHIVLIFSQFLVKLHLSKSGAVDNIGQENLGMLEICGELV